MSTCDPQPTIRERQRRWEAFVRPGGPPGFLFLVRWPDPRETPRPPLWPERRRERIEWIWNTYRQQTERAAWLNDDFIPRFGMVTGTEVFAEAFGCRVHRPPDDMPFARPLIRSASDVARVDVPELSTSSLAYLFEMADELHHRDPEAVFQLVDIQSPMDIAALILEKQAFYTALIDAPEAVKELTLKVRRLLVAFLDEWFRRYGTRYVAHYPDYFMAGGMTLSEDEVGSVGADMFQEFFLPELAFLSERYGGLGMHCCANARHQWANFKCIPGLRVLNLVQPPEVVADAFSFFADGPVQMHSGALDGAPAAWPGTYPPHARVVLEVNAKTRQEARRAARQLSALRGA